MLEGTPRFSFVTERGRYEHWIPAAGVVLERVSGHADGEIARVLIERLAEVLEETSPMSLFFDFEELESYDAAARSQLTGWTKAHQAELRMVHVLVRSRLVATGVSVANVALGGFMRSHTERPRFEAALKLELEQARAAPRKT
jgi:hypothetical protein